MTHKNIGDSGELFAVCYLKRHGYTIIGRNVYVRWGELDIIATKNNTLVFFEVKLSRTLIPAEELYTPVKKRKVHRSANIWLVEHQQRNYINIAIGLVAIQQVCGLYTLKIYMEPLY